LPEPELPTLERPYGIVVTGVGGTGVVTIGALIGMAAHLDGKGCSVLDQLGLAQKGGSVISHLRVAAKPEDITATRIASGGADLVLGGDLLTTGNADTLNTMAEGRTRVIGNSHETMPGDFTRNKDLEFPGARIKRVIQGAVGDGASEFIEATRLATALMGDAIASNLFLLGFAWQRGLVPVSGDAMMQAIAINGVAVEMNQRAFAWGRRAAVDADAVAAAAFPRGAPGAADRARTLEEIVSRRSDELVRYQGDTYAARYRSLVEKVRRQESERANGLSGLAEAVARNYFKLLAYKDEYEVARLYTDPAFKERLEQTFEGDYSLEFHLAPPILARRDPNSGEPSKKSYGPGMLKVFATLAKLKGLRGTVFDVFGYTAERRMERALIAEYEQTVATLLTGLTPDNHDTALAIASVPEQIRGFGHVKAASAETARARRAELLAAFRAAVTPRPVAA
jgi:indolepyruvate ferredoxin oxidoreductase